MKSHLVNWKETCQQWKEVVQILLSQCNLLYSKRAEQSGKGLFHSELSFGIKAAYLHFQTNHFPDTKVTFMSARTAITKTEKSSLISRVLPGVVVLATVALGIYFVQSSGMLATEEKETVEAETTEGLSNVVTLPVEKVMKANFVTESVGIQEVDHIHTVPGRLAYNEALHIEVKAPVSGVLLDVLVKPGDIVQKDQVLAVINSSEIGQARAAILNEDAKYQLALKQMSRLQEVTQNLNSLFELLDKNVRLDEIENQFNDKALGTYREDVISSYSERYLANQMSGAAKSLSDSESLPMKLQRERENARHVTDARFRSVRESTAYSVKLKKQELEAELANAERQVMIAKNHLETLLGVKEDNTNTLTSESLSKMEIRAPFAGTIESRFLAKLERARQSDALFILANTQSLYVSADIRENDWSAMSIKQGQEIQVEVPAIPGRTFIAKVHYIGREVAIDSNSLPLVATIGNSDGLLRPGMFVRVQIPMAETASVVAVPQESVIQHENQSFVFVKLDDHSFQRTDVKTGTSNEKWVEVTEGLEVGQSVVSHGAVLLKSELLLASEE